jgi:hypothetical protein
MIDPKIAGAIWQQHFDTVTDEEFVANIKRFDPDFAEELWGTPPAAVTAESKRLDPEVAQAVMKEDATATGQQIVDDLWRHSPAPRGMRGFFAAFGRSVQRLFT